jgi:glyoxylase-like metal-dependent hydrolase (beta-lactamase superfamily II)
MPTSRRIGAVTVIALHDATGVFFQTRQEAFPQATAEHWRQADARDAGAERDGEWLLRFRCFALRHTPGHQSVLLDAGGGAVLFTGDLLVHAVQLVDPALSYAFESDPDMARASRVALLSELAAREGTILATSHLSEPFGLLRPQRT